MLNKMDTLTKHLKEVADIKVGYQSKSRIWEALDGTHRLIQSKDFDSRRMLHTDKLIKLFPERKPTLYEVNKGDVLLQARGIEHFAYCLNESLENTLAAGTFYILRIKSTNISPGYLAWWINQTPSQVYIKSHAIKSAISFISKRAIAYLPVRIPSLDIQHKIEKTVELWQREQLLQHRLMECKDRLIQAVCLKSTLV